MSKETSCLIYLNLSSVEEIQVGSSEIGRQLDQGGGLVGVGGLVGDRRVAKFALVSGRHGLENPDRTFVERQWSGGQRIRISRRKVGEIILTNIPIITLSTYCCFV